MASPGNDQRSFDVVLVDIPAIAGYLDLEERATPRLSTCDSERAIRMSAHSPNEGRAWRTARVATRIVLERWIGPEIRGRAFALEPGGRPHLGSGAVAFSLSHSGSFALIAVARHGTIGADIEQVRPLRMSDERRARIVSAARRLSPSCSPIAAPLSAYGEADVLQAWVRLEAIAKASGLGIAHLLTKTGVIGDGKANLGQRLSGLAVRDLVVGSDDGPHTGNATTLDPASALLPSPAVWKSSRDQPREPVAYVAAIAAPSLPAVIPVTSFPANADALARFLANAA